MESIYDGSTLLNRFASFKHAGSYGVCYKFLTPREYRKESSMTSDSINRLILEYLGTEDIK